MSHSVCGRDADACPSLCLRAAQFQVAVPSMIARHYARGWLAFDVIATFPLDSAIQLAWHTKTSNIQTISIVRMLVRSVCLVFSFLFPSSMECST